MDRRRCSHLSPSAIQHPLDRDAGAVLRAAAGFDDLVRWLFDYGFERWERLALLGSAVRVSDKQFPEIAGIFAQTCARLGVDQPPLYLASGSFNALTAGVDRPYVVISPGVITLTPSELEYVLGHELGHIKLQHVLYGTVARALPLFASLVPVAGQLLTSGLNLAIQEWQRRAELSCDRYGLLANQDLQAALRLMVKVAGAPPALYSQINTGAFLDQYDELTEAQNDKVSLVYRVLSELRLSHPWMVVRAKELARWVESGAYAALIETGDAEEPATKPEIPSLEDACRAAAERLPGALGEALAQLSLPVPPRVSFTGGKGRGRSTLIHKLLGHEVIPARANPVRLVAGERWTLHDASGKLLSEDLPFPASSGSITIRGPAPLLEIAELRELPGFDGLDNPLDLAAELAATDIVIFCTSATQLLSDGERRWLREELLPRATGPVAVVVTRGDDLDEPDRLELQARLDRVMASLSEGLNAPPWVFWWTDEADPPLVTWLTAQLSRLGVDQERRRRARIDRLVNLARLRHAGDRQGDETLERRLQAARAACRRYAADRLGTLRTELPQRLEQLDHDQLNADGPALVRGEIIKVEQELAALFLEETGSDPGARLGGRLAEEMGGADWSQRSPRRPRDPGAMALAGASVLLVLLSGLTPLTAAGAAAGIAGARLLRGRQESNLQALRRTELSAATLAWLDQVEAAIPAMLAAWSAELRRILTNGTDAEEQALLAACLDAISAALALLEASQPESERPEGTEGEEPDDAAL